MIPLLLASLITYCPHPADPNVQGIRTWAYQVSPYSDVLHPCPPGLCDGGLAVGEIHHNYAEIPMDAVILPNGHHALDLEDVAQGGIIMFGVQYWYADGTCAGIGECTDVWWDVSMDLTAPCDCTPPSSCAP